MHGESEQACLHPMPDLSQTIHLGCNLFPQRKLRRQAHPARATKRVLWLEECGGPCHPSGGSGYAQQRFGPLCEALMSCEPPWRSATPFVPQAVWQPYNVLQLIHVEGAWSHLAPSIRQATDAQRLRFQLAAGIFNADRKLAQSLGLACLQFLPQHRQLCLQIWYPSFHSLHVATYPRFGTSLDHALGHPQTKNAHRTGVLAL